jgi:hypothetical protein
MRVRREAVLRILDVFAHIRDTLPGDSDRRFHAYRKADTPSHPASNTAPAQRVADRYREAIVRMNFIDRLHAVADAPVANTPC